MQTLSSGFNQQYKIYQINSLDKFEQILNPIYFESNSDSHR